MTKQQAYYATPICHAEGNIDIAVRSPDDKIICTTLGLVGDDVVAAISQAFATAKLIADALNAYGKRGQS